MKERYLFLDVYDRKFNKEMFFFFFSFLLLLVFLTLLQWVVDTVSGWCTKYNNNSYDIHNRKYLITLCILCWVCCVYEMSSDNNCDCYCILDIVNFKMRDVGLLLNKMVLYFFSYDVTIKILSCFRYGMMH